jgi:hypothetical protein
MSTEEMKHCNGCNEDKPISEFHNDKNSKDGKTRNCKVCNNARTNARRLADPHGTYLRAQESRKRNWEYYQTYKKEWDQANQEIRDNDRLTWRFDISLDEYWERLARQADACDICGTLEPRTRGGRFFAVDHDRDCCPGAKSCGKCVRGIICNRCNTYVIPVYQGRQVGNIDAEYLFVRAYVNEYIIRRAVSDAEESLETLTSEESGIK